MKLFGMFLLIVSCFSCASDSKGNKSGDIEFTPSELEVTYEELELDKDNTSKYYLDGKVAEQEKTNAIKAKSGGKDKYTLTSYTGSKGYLFEIFVPKGESPVGEHSLAKDSGNRLILNHVDGNLIEVYGSAFCFESVPGNIKIDSYENDIISGQFTVTVCNLGKNGQENSKTLNNAKFKVKVQKL